MSVSLEFNHHWEEVFWCWGIDIDEFPHETLQKVGFYQKFGKTCTNQSDIVPVWNWLSTRSKEMEKLLHRGLFRAHLEKR